MALALVEKYSNNECPSSANPDQYPTRSTSRRQIINTKYVLSVNKSLRTLKFKNQQQTTTPSLSKWMVQSTDINLNVNESPRKAMIKSSHTQKCKDGQQQTTITTLLKWQATNSSLNALKSTAGYQIETAKKALTHTKYIVKTKNQFTARITMN